MIGPTRSSSSNDDKNSTYRRNFLLIFLISISLSLARAQCPENVNFISNIPSQLSGTLTGAPSLGAFGSICPATSAGEEPVSVASPVWWAEFQGTGETLFITTCNSQIRLDTRLILLNTPNNATCPDLACVDSADDYNGDICSTITLESQMNQFYFVAVLPYDLNETSTFRLDISNSAPASCAPGAIQAPYISDIRPQVAIAGDSSLSSAALIPSCPLIGSTNLTGSWIQIFASRDVGGLDFSTCNPGTNYDTRMILYQSELCESCYCAACVRSNDDLIKDVATCSEISYTFPPAPPSSDASYVLLWVFITSSQKSSGVLGAFNLTISSRRQQQQFPQSSQQVLGTTCEEAPVVPVPITLSTNNFNSIASARPCSLAGTAWSSRRGLWFQFGGTGGDVTVHTCPSIGFSTTVYGYTQQQNCSSCSCIASCSVASTSFYTSRGCGQIVFTNTSADVKYYVWVGSFSTTAQTGSFTVRVLPGFILPFAPAPITFAPTAPVAPLPPGTPGTQIRICTAAPILIRGIPWEQSSSLSVNSLFTAVDCDLSTSHRGTWYRYIAQATEDLIATTCHPANTMQTSISIFTDSCDENSCCAECYTFNDNMPSLDSANENPKRIDSCSNTTSYIRFTAERQRSYYFYVRARTSVSALAQITFRLLRAADYTPDAVAARQRVTLGLSVGVPLVVIAVILVVTGVICFRRISKAKDATGPPRAVPLAPITPGSDRTKDTDAKSEEKLTEKPKKVQKDMKFEVKSAARQETDESEEVSETKTGAGFRQMRPKRTT